MQTFVILSLLGERVAGCDIPDTFAKLISSNIVKGEIDVKGNQSCHKSESQKHQQREYYIDDEKSCLH